jgi:hypothetical protein
MFVIRYCSVDSVVSDVAFLFHSFLCSGPASSTSCLFLSPFSLSAVVFLPLCEGPEIRTGTVDPSLPGGKVKYTRGDIIEVGTDYSKPCTSSYLPCSYQSLPKSAKVGNRILIADGSMSIRVKEIKETSILAEVLNNATLGSKVLVFLLDFFPFLSLNALASASFSLSSASHSCFSGFLSRFIEKYESSWMSY